MADINSTDPSNREDAAEKPSAASFQDLILIENQDRTNESTYTTFYLVTPNEKVYFGQLFKSKKDVTLAECNSALKRIKDDEIYPKIPNDIALTIALPDILNDTTSVFIKKPGLYWYEVMKGTNFIPKELRNETLIMEQVSKLHHPNIIPYYGCLTRRGRITGIALKHFDQTLTKYALNNPDFQQLDKIKFFEALESAVASLHSLGLAHNDINPDNIMMENDGTPILIDFGSCQPFGKRLQSCGSPGWCEEDFDTSEKKHDAYSLGILRKWLQKPKPMAWF